MLEHSERFRLPYTPAQAFDLVADVDRYPEFIPGLREAHIRRRKDNRIWVDMEVSAGILSRRFTSYAILDRPSHITIFSDDPLFERFEQIWTFQPAPEGGTIVEHRINFRFRSRLLRIVMGAVFAKRVASTVRAFKCRARAVYGH